MKYTKEEMQIRDSFAAAALTGLLAGGYNIHEASSDASYIFADEMMVSRMKNIEITQMNLAGKKLFTLSIEDCNVRDGYCETCDVLIKGRKGSCTNLSNGYCKLGHGKNYKFK